jgi:hypothetical protein
VAQVERLRVAAANAIGADADEVAIVPSASVAISTIATAISFDGERRKVVLGDFEFPTMAHVWMAQQSRGAEIVRARRTARCSRPPRTLRSSTSRRASCRSRTSVSGTAIASTSPSSRRSATNAARSCSLTITSGPAQRRWTDQDVDAVLRALEAESAWLVRERTLHPDHV